MGNLSAHFSRHEFTCKCGCGQDTVDYELIVLLEHIRNHFTSPVIVNSGNRCLHYNAKVGGAKNSQHLISKAADIVVVDYSPIEVHAFLEPWHGGGLGKYNSFTHVDVRDKRVRWDNST